MFAAAQTSAMLSIYWALRGNDLITSGSLGNLFELEFVYQFHLGLIIYWLILAVARGLEARRHLLIPTLTKLRPFAAHLQI